MKIAVVADWLPTYGGAEHVLGALMRIWPRAPLFTTVARHGNIGPLRQYDIRVRPWLQRLFRLTRKHQWLLPLLPGAMERIDLQGFDVVVSSSHAVGKGVIPPGSAVHVCYCHTPMRYAWEMENEYLKDFRIRWPLSTFVKRELKRLRRWDMSTAKRVDHFIANSTETQRRIERIYGRESVVIPPPVEARFFTEPFGKRSGGLLAIGRLVPYKRFDLLIGMANTMKLPLTIGGTGSDLPRLKALAGPTVRFLGYVPESDLPKLYASAEAVLFPQNEDAGIVPMEAGACGTPVVAYKKGGAVDIVEDGVTGLLVEEQTEDAFLSSIERFRTRTWDHTMIRDRARKFHEDAFRKRMEEEVRIAVERFQGRL